MHMLPGMAHRAVISLKGLQGSCSKCLQAMSAIQGVLSKLRDCPFLMQSLRIAGGVFSKALNLAVLPVSLVSAIAA
jgi:hypothetical protein